VHLVGFIIKKFVSMHGHMNLKNPFEYSYECDDVAQNCTEPGANVLILIWLPSSNLYSYSSIV